MPERALIQVRLSELLLRSWLIMRELQGTDIPVVEKSVPILYFGSLSRYLLSPLRVVTVALNPSRNEFPIEDPAWRFPGADESSPEAHFDALNKYFDAGHKPLWEWFKHFDWLLAGLGSGFRPGRAASALHTDLCSPIATDPTYSHLAPMQRRELERLGMPLWAELCELLDPDVIVMSGGRLMRDRVVPFTNANWLTVFGSNRKSVKLAEIDVWGRPRVAVFGLTTQVPFGALSLEERKLVGTIVRDHIRIKKTCGVRDPVRKHDLSTGLISMPFSHARQGFQATGATPEAPTTPIAEQAVATPSMLGSVNLSGRGESAMVSYRFSRLCFRRDVIDSLGIGESFRIITPIGTFQMTRADFYRDFQNVVVSRSYRIGGVYHYPKVPSRAEQYRVRD